MVEELHTRECLEYAAKTRRAFCVDQCAQARRAREASESARTRDYKGEAAMDAALAISDEYSQARDLIAGESLVDALKRFHDDVCAAPAAPLGIAGRLLDDLLESHARVTGSSDYSYTDYDGDVEIVRRRWNDARAVAGTTRAGLDWTVANGRANSSSLYLALVAEVTDSIKDIRVGSPVEPTARVIVSQLAHVHGLAPLPHAKPVVITLELHGCMPGLDHEAPAGGCRYGTNRCITHAERDDAARVTIHYFKLGSGKWKCTDREIEWPRDPEYYTRWRAFDKVTRLPDLVAVCIDTPLGYPISRPVSVERWRG